VSAGSGGGVLQGDAVAEGLEAGDQASCFAFGVELAGEVVGAEFLVGFSGGQDVPVDEDQGVGDDDDGFVLGDLAAVAAPFDDVPVVEGFEVAVVADGGPGALDQDGLQVRVVLAAFSTGWPTSSPGR
jgi:hypothetical protein